MVEHEAARVNQLQSSVRQLEKEKDESAQTLLRAKEYQVAFSNAANRLSVSKQKISELEKEMEGMVQTHDVAAFQLGAVKQKISELEKEKEGMVHDHDVAVVNAANRLSAAK